MKKSCTVLELDLIRIRPRERGEEEEVE